MKFSEIIDGLNEGKSFTREAWINNAFIARQVPQTVAADIVPRMTSLPDVAKWLVTSYGDGSISYHDQVLRVTIGEPSTATCYIPTWEDIFANDWMEI